MKNKLLIYLIGLILIAVPFKIAFLTPSSSFFVNIASFLSVLTGFLVILFGGAKDGQEHEHS
jgi:hypothetical protein